MVKSKKQILVVDDEPAYRKMVVRFLSNHGYDVSEAESGAEALAVLRQLKPDLIMSDVRMPDMNGFDLLESIKKLPKLSSTPVIFFSAIDDFDARKVAKALGAAAYLVKPFDEREVNIVLSSILP